MTDSSSIHLGFFFPPSEILSLGVRGLLYLLSFGFVFGGFFVLFWGVGFVLFCFLGVLGGLFSKIRNFKSFICQTCAYIFKAMKLFQAIQLQGWEPFSQISMCLYVNRCLYEIFSW